MKTLIQMVLGVVVIASMTGCATPYMIDRRRDAADVLTVAGGIGLGGKARIGPVHAGLVIYGADVGLYAGDIVECDGGSCRHIIGTELIGWGSELMYPRLRPDLTSTERLKTKWYLAESPVLPFITTGFSGYDEKHPRFPHPYWTQCEVQLGLFFSARLGFNPGELLDFILGWFCVDIYHDDLAQREAEEEARPKLKRTR